MSGPCPFGEVRLQPSTSELPALNRTFVWDVRAHKSIGLELQFSAPRLRQIGPGESCADGVTHSISGHIDATEVRIGTFCSNGTVSRIKMQEGCLDHYYCYGKSFHLQVPRDILQLPVQLHDFSWKLLMPKGRLSLMMVPSQKLQQNTRERPCNTSFGYLVASTTPSQDLYFGSFCPGGSIEKIQVKQNSSVTLRTYAPSFQQEVSRHGLTVSFIPYFKEEGIFTVTPDPKNKVYLRTPNWDRGLPALSSVSWNISVPSNQVACLTFFKERSGVVCQSGRAYMIIQEQQTRAEEIFSLEEEVLPKPSFHRRSFWVNISNCSPVTGKQLDLLFWVTLTPRTVDLAAIIGAVGGGALLLFALVLIICCVKKKKKVNKGPAVGIYNGNVNTQVPQAQKFPKRRKDNDSHVYAVIDDTMVYGHLLQDSGGSFIQPEVDTYRPFQGPMGDCPPAPPPVFSRTPTAKFTADEPAPSSPPECESEPYTFSHPSKEEVSVRETDIPLLNTQGPVETEE
ncbi:CUB domain-containing protein 1 [Lemmus lemmus]